MIELLHYTQRADPNLRCHPSIPGETAGSGSNRGGTGMLVSSISSGRRNGAAPAAPPGCLLGEVNGLSLFLWKARSSPCGMDGGYWRRLNGIGLIRFFPENLEVLPNLGSQKMLATDISRSQSLTKTGRKCDSGSGPLSDR